MDAMTKGYTESQKFDAKKIENRGQTGDDKGQRPVQQSSSVKTAKGSFKMKG